MSHYCYPHCPTSQLLLYTMFYRRCFVAVHSHVYHTHTHFLKEHSTKLFLLLYSTWADILARFHCEGVTSCLVYFLLQFRAESRRSRMQPQIAMSCWLIERSHLRNLPLTPPNLLSAPIRRRKPDKQHNYQLTGHGITRYLINLLPLKRIPKCYHKHPFAALPLTKHQYLSRPFITVWWQSMG